MISKIIEVFTGGFTEMISKSVEAIKNGFANFLWVDPNAEVLELSTLAEWSLVFLGIGASIGLVKLIMHIVRG